MYSNFQENNIKEYCQRIWYTSNNLKGKIHVEELRIIFYLITYFRNNDVSNKYISVSEISEDIFNNTNIDFDDRDKIHQVYVPILKKISEHEISEIFHSFSAIDRTVFLENFTAIFDNLLYSFSKSLGRFGGEFLLPKELSLFVSNLVELDANAKVYNPFAGVASFGLFFEKPIQYLGQEINQNIWALGSLRLLAYNKNSNYDYRLDDSLENFQNNSHYDLIIANPPYNVKSNSPILYRFGLRATVENFFIINAFTRLSETGKIIAIIPNSILFKSGNETDLRKFLVANDVLEMVISLPSGLLQSTGIPLAILVINKAKKLKGHVKFIDAQYSFNSISKKEKVLNLELLNSLVNSYSNSKAIRVVTNDKINEFDYNLNVARYLIDEIDGIKLNDILIPVRGKKTNSPIGKVVKIRDLKSDFQNYYLDCNEIETSEISKSFFKIDESCILVASKWKTLKPTFFEFKGEPIYISSDIFAFKLIDNSILLNYLILELDSQSILNQISSYRTGSIIPFLKRNEFLDLKIPFISLNDQTIKVNEYFSKLPQTKKSELDKLSLENELIEQNTHLRHTLAGPASNIKGSFSNIKKIITDKLSIAMPDILKTKLTENHELTLGDYISIIERDVAKISDAVNRQLSTEDNFADKSLYLIDIIAFMQNFVKHYIDHNKPRFIFQLDIDEDFHKVNGEEVLKVFIYGNEDLLNDLLFNLIDNAVAHAFSQDNKNRIEISIINNSYVAELDEVQILFSNNGKPFPKDFTLSDFKRKGAKIGENARNGYGGWYINEIVKHMKGNLDMIDETGPEGLPTGDLTTSFEINFPIFDTNENEEI